MVTLGMDNYYFDALRCLNLLHFLWPDISLHAPNHLNVPTTPNTTIPLLWINHTEIIYGFFCVIGFMMQKPYVNNMMFNQFNQSLSKRDSWTTYNLQYIIPKIPDVFFSSEILKIWKM